MLIRVIRAKFPALTLRNSKEPWFVGINVIGFFIFRRCFEKQARESGLTLLDLGISYRDDRFALDWVQIGKTILLAVFLFLFAYLCEHLWESIFIVDFRFIFPSQVIAPIPV